MNARRAGIALIVALLIASLVGWMFASRTRRRRVSRR